MKGRWNCELDVIEDLLRDLGEIPEGVFLGIALLPVAVLQFVVRKGHHLAVSKAKGKMQELILTVIKQGEEFHRLYNAHHAGVFPAFDGLGEFSRRTGTLVFMPDASNLLDESFGLPSFNFPMLPSETKPRVKSAIIKGTPDKKGKKRGKGRAIAWSLSAVAVIAGLVCMSLYMGWFDNLFGNGNGETVFAGFGFGGNNEQVAENRVEEAPEETAADFAEEQGLAVENQSETDEVVDEIVESAVEEIVAENVETEEVAVEPVSEPKVEIAKANPDIKVHIIAGCFSVYSNAENVYNDLVSKGLSPQILPQQNGLYKVSVKGFATTADACAELQGLKEQSGNDQLWIMKM